MEFVINNNISYDIMKCLVASLEAKDIYTGGHSSRVASMIFDLCKKLNLPSYQISIIYIAAQLHDIGKIGIPDYILNKKDSLTKDEWDKIKSHPEIGYSILIRSNKLKNIAKLVLHHHERWDGKGYPHGLKEEEIPLGSRIIAICDTIDAMTSNRPYRDRFTFKECYDEIIRNRGIQFDPFLVDSIGDLWTKWEKYLMENIM
ncbi:phosphohydrolase [Caloranaerobacter sp. TR13]|uniref:HD-GYP domain-containing protein n=1 Tax=Caloranaerobacter sp. TR13 TaxID=1302151 RepID=UPI0006D3B211|nr:HD-GYP domain-containing protein [Caloranaerobacter sp. TR13]KPU27597.1 phosphohydrolase [Caloranaerobacter sp. TR13]